MLIGDGEDPRKTAHSHSVQPWKDLEGLGTGELAAVP